MRRPVCALLWMLLVAGCATPGNPAPADPVPVKLTPDQASRVRKKVDPQTGVTSYSVLPDLGQSRAGELSLTGFLITRRGGPRPADRAELGFQVTSKQMRFNQCDRLTFEIDGQPLPPRTVKHFSSIGAGQIVEAVVAPVSPDELSRMARARQVAYRLCETRGELSAVDRALLSRMVSLWQAPAPAAPPPTRPR